MSTGETIKLNPATPPVPYNQLWDDIIKAEIIVSEWAERSFSIWNMWEGSAVQCSYPQAYWSDTGGSRSIRSEIIVGYQEKSGLMRNYEFTKCGLISSIMVKHWRSTRDGIALEMNFVRGESGVFTVEKKLYYEDAWQDSFRPILDRITYHNERNPKILEFLPEGIRQLLIDNTYEPEYLG